MNNVIKHIMQFDASGELCPPVPIDKRVWQRAANCIKELGKQENHQNIYACYLDIRTERKLLDILQELVFKKKISIATSCKYSDVFHIDYLTDVERIEKEIARVTNNIGDKSVLKLDRRKAIIKAMQDAMTRIYNEEGVNEQQLHEIGSLIDVKSSESDVYLIEGKNLVCKSRDIYSHDSMRPHDVFDTFYEHIAHNLLFPNAFLYFCGYGYRDMQPTLLFLQVYRDNIRCATDKEIARYMHKLGLELERKFYFGNEYLAVTDVCGKNVLADNAGNLYFIDTNIYFKRPAKEVLAYLTKDKNYACK